MLITNKNGSNLGKWDLHMYSNASDGKASPKQIIEVVKEKGLAIVALTEHCVVNNINGIKMLDKENDIILIAKI